MREHAGDVGLRSLCPFLTVGVPFYLLPGRRAAAEEKTRRNRPDLLPGDPA